MSETQTNVRFPLDSDGFFRRECPLCHREFKVLFLEQELTTLAQRGIDSFMLKQEEESSEGDEKKDSDAQLFCPYCGQCAPNDSWWTQEQAAYIQVIAGNIVTKLINEHLVRPLKRNSGQPKGGLISFRFEAKEMEQEKPWISPEADDMDVFDLPCCQRKMKIIEDWKGNVHCFFCGFPHFKRAEM